MTFKKPLNVFFVSLLFASGHSMAQFDATINLSDVNGQNGFVIIGENLGDSLGTSVSPIGDTNNDGIDDIILGAPLAKIPAANHQNPPISVGKAYVVTGSDSGFSQSLNLDFSVPDFHGGAENDEAGETVSAAGDVNGDGISDFLMGANNAGSEGQIYVWYGGFLSFGSYDLSSIIGFDGFTINPETKHTLTGGIPLGAAGDFNGDGIDDIIVGNPSASPGSKSFAGKSYVIFGNDAMPTSAPVFVNLADLDGSNGVIINGELAGDLSGSAVGSAGDLNGDGVDDIIIGAPRAKRNSDFYEGTAYVVFGSDSAFTSPIELDSLNGTNGFIINHVNAWDRLGTSVSAAGDINNDGFDDIIIGAPEINPSVSTTAGSSYVIFGSQTQFPNPFELNTINGSNGVRIIGAEIGDQLGWAVNTAGDVNGDNIDDIITGARAADINGLRNAGAAYVVFGNKAGLAHPLNVNNLDGNNGFAIHGVGAHEQSGSDVSSAGDLNADGVDDILVAVYLQNKSYVIFGNDVIFANNFSQ